MTREELKRAKDLADMQYYPAAESGSCDDCIGFEFKGQWIIHPWIDQSARFELTTEQAIAIYGEENLNLFCKRILWAHDKETE